MIFYGWYNSKKVTVEADSLWEAKKKVVTLLKVPLSKTGRVAVMSVDTYENEEFRLG